MNHLTLRDYRMARRRDLHPLTARVADLHVGFLLHEFPHLTLSEIIRELIMKTIIEFFGDPQAILRNLLYSQLYLGLEATLDVLRLPGNGPYPPEAAEQLLLPWHMQEAA